MTYVIPLFLLVGEHVTGPARAAVALVGMTGDAVML
jgi:hypothetical protein